MLALLALVPLGRYFVSLGAETRRLDLRADRRFAYVAQGCFHRDESRGRFRVEGDVLLLSPPPETGDGEDAAERYRIVPWDGAAFLVEEADLPEFAARARGGWRGDQAGAFSLRLGPPEARAGRPTLPAPWRSQLDRPLAPKIVRVDGATVTLDAGGAEGLRPGTCLVGIADGVDVLAVVRSIRPHEAVAAWGALDASKPFRLVPGLPLRFDGDKAEAARFLRVSLLRGEWLPKSASPEGP